MPRNVRNFWIEGSVDGAKKEIGTGPKAANGGFNLTVLVRENGSISDKRVKIWGRSQSDGKLVLQIELRGCGEENAVHIVTTER